MFSILYLGSLRLFGCFAIATTTGEMLAALIKLFSQVGIWSVAKSPPLNKRRRRICSGSNTLNIGEKEHFLMKPL